MNTQIIGFTLGTILTILGVALTIPAMVDVHYDHDNASVFFWSSVTCLFFGGLFYFSSRGRTYKDITIRQGFALTTFTWIAISVFGALPLYMSDINISFTDAFFEAVSAYTTTGSTVLSGLDSMSHGLLVWRAIMQWIGGIGIVAFAIVMLPFLRVGGMQLFKTESSDKSDKIMPRTADVMSSLLVIYCGLTVLCALTYYVLGMSGFDAIAHAMTTIPTAGFSTHDKSFGFFNSYALDMAGVFFMLMGALPFLLYVRFVYQGRLTLLRDAQVRTFLLMVLAIVVVLTWWLTLHSDYGLAQSFRYVSFNIVSVITTTGYASTDYNQWGPFALMVFFIVTYLGGCTGSSAGGIKTMRLMITAALIGRQIRTLLYPHSVNTVLYQGKPVTTPIAHSVLMFLFFYVVANVFTTILLTFAGLDLVTAITGAAMALANVGPGLGPIIGPAGNFGPLPDAAKWVLSAAMILGRLEIMTVLVMLTPAYWRN